jgi:hypothetical protein
MVAGGLASADKIAEKNDFRNIILPITTFPVDPHILKADPSGIV